MAASVLTAVFKVDVENRIVKGPVLRPEIRDRQGTIMSAAVIKQTAHDFVINLRKAGQSLPGVMHQLFDRSIDFVESYLTDVEKLIWADELDEQDASVQKVVWTGAYVDDLPDSSFLFVEKGGEQVDGKTMPRTKRYMAVKDATGKINIPQVKAALAQVEKLTAEGVDDVERTRLTTEAQALLAEARKGTKSYRLPKGSWILAAKVEDDATWKAVLAKKFRGWSVGGLAKAVRENVQVETQKTLVVVKRQFAGLRSEDLGDHRYLALKADEVSIVTHPAALLDDEDDAGLGFISVAKLKSAPLEELPTVVTKAIQPLEDEDFEDAIARLVATCRLKIMAEYPAVESTYWLDRLRVKGDYVTLGRSYCRCDDPEAFDQTVYQCWYTQNAQGGFEVTRVVPMQITFSEVPGPAAPITQTEAAEEGRTMKSLTAIEFGGAAHTVPTQPGVTVDMRDDKGVVVCKVLDGKAELVPDAGYVLNDDGVARKPATDYVAALKTLGPDYVLAPNPGGQLVFVHKSQINAPAAPAPAPAPAPTPAPAVTADPTLAQNPEFMAMARKVKEMEHRLAGAPGHETQPPAPAPAAPANASGEVVPVETQKYLKSSVNTWMIAGSPPNVQYHWLQRIQPLIGASN